MVCIRIVDDGEGISDQVRPRLFRAFATDKEGGTGLGLAQAKSVVELHGGTIDLTSHPTGGTSATIHLPVGPGDDVTNTPQTG
jgi:signal transduction histidine kinase